MTQAGRHRTSGTVLVTGATGFLGTQIVRHLLRNPDTAVIAIVRAKDQQAAVHRLSRAWWDWPELSGAIGGRVRVVPGDVSLRRFGLDEGVCDELARRMTHIIHAAADLRINAPIEELRQTNFRGTANVLEFARMVNDAHGLTRYSHVSTAYVAGGRTGPVPEEDLTDKYGFSSSYEFSKYEGEQLVLAAKPDLPVSVFRPGMIVGDSHTGAIKTFNTLYYPLRLYLTGALRVLPARRDLLVNLVPVDYVAEAIVRLTFDPHAEGLNFHLTAPSSSLPRVDELLAFVRDWAGEHLGVRLPRPWFFPLPVPRWMYRPAQSALQAKGSSGALLSLLPYFNARLQFRRENADRLLGPYDLQWRDLVSRLIDHAVSMGFMHRSDRTIHEQVLFRLNARSRPITFQDAIGGKVVSRSAGEVRQDMMAALKALRAHGIRRGDRVAIVGYNSTRYLTLDVAIGLSGAVTVPLYYTSPPAEIDAILQASGARLLLIGTPKLLERLGELRSDLPVVSFCRGALPDGLPRKVLSWDEFLASYSLESEPATGEEGRPAPVSLGDLATLRYTSGTTGNPKGVVFHHEHLRWMGECIAGLLPWEARNAPVRWLSCLPMNHVVEGILATYAPYYIPAPVNVCFLENLHDLQRTLPLVRPTMFFSVPRVYEKIWEGLEKNRLGRFCLRLHDGMPKRLLRPWLCRRVLRKSGLDRCAQLIVGSAPAGEQLLNGFHKLGIEIHNAYGLTEAPLVTINRVGANRLGTVGEPLPATQVRIAEDGEVLVKGPQVAAGYFEDNTSPVKDGWLFTGDLGHLTAGGSLVLHGRKKELIKTSYGKQIQPAKVEALLKEIPGVVEAMLVGEERPHCVAILWVTESHRNSGWTEEADRSVQAVNHQLSHPEQVKRWAILTNDLTVEGGDLTANLKLKRKVAARRFHQVIEALYAVPSSPIGTLPQNVLHIGQTKRDDTR